MKVYIPTLSKIWGMKESFFVLSGLPDSKDLCIGLLSWLVVLRIYVALAVFQPYRDLEAGDNQSLKFKWQGGESNPAPLALQAKRLTTQPRLLPWSFKGAKPKLTWQRGK